jgi:outer membrane protein assembly factor BamB
MTQKDAFVLPLPFAYTLVMRRRDLLKGLVACLPARALLADSWPQFRGPGARGIAGDDRRLPLTWSDSENVLWRIDVPGRGWSSPVVWNDQIFIQSTVSTAGEGLQRKGMFGGRQQYYPPPDEHRWMLDSFDISSGKTRWATELFKGVPKVSRHPKNSFASETPVTDGERVYAHFGDVGTYCLDMTGKILWSKEWPLIETRYGYGTGSSPALHEGRLYIVNDNEKQSYMLALDKLTGREIWRVTRDEPTTWATPYIWRNERRTEIVTVGTKKVRSYDLKGNLLWEITGMSLLAIPSPFASDGLLYVASGYPTDEKRPVYAIRPGASGDITPADNKPGSEYIAWSLPQGGPYVPSPIIYGGLYYTLLDSGFLTCHDAKTGKEIYGKQRIDSASSGFTSSPWAYNSCIFCLNEDGDTYVIQAGPEFKILGKNSLGDTCLSSPAIASGSLILRTLTHLYRIGHKV